MKNASFLIGFIKNK